MGFRVELHRARAPFRGDVGDHREAPRRVLVNDGQRPVAIRGEGQLGARIESTRIHPLADRDRRDQRTVGRVGDRHELVAATAEQQMVDPIDGQPRGRLAGRDRPLALHTHRSRVELRHRILVLQVHEQLPVSRGNAELRTRPELDIAEPFSRDGIDRGGGMRVAVEGEDALGRRVVQNGIVVRGHHRVAEHSERLEIEHRDGAVRPRRGEAVTRFIREGHAVGPIQTRDLPEHFSAVGVDHDDAVLVRDEQPMAHGVEGEVVPAPVAGEPETTGNVVGLRCGGKHGAAEQDGPGDECSRRSVHELLRCEV